SVTVQEEVALVQPALNPAKEEPLFATAVRVTGVPGEKLAEQVVPQLIPDGAEVTVPTPVPDRLMVRIALLAPVLMPLTVTEFEELVVVPFPSWPALFKPQHLTVPSDRFTQV